MKIEGFNQNERFLIKRNSDIYDNFYANLYDKLYGINYNVDFITNIIIKNTIANTNTSVILVIDSGTGHLSNNLMLKGFSTFSIDRSKSMIEYATKLYPNIKIKNDDIQVPMTYEKNTFSHIICVNMSLYKIKDKYSFFRNIYTFLIPNGYFIVQMADRSKFDTIIPSGRSSVLTSPQLYTEERITETHIDFTTFTYNSKYDFDKATTHDIVLFNETFTDKVTHNVRKNDHVFYFENIKDITNIALKCGFTVKGLVNVVDDKNQFIYIFERTQ
jgi:SAM-dependent methyltransferase